MPAFYSLPAFIILSATENICIIQGNEASYIISLEWIQLWLEFVCCGSQLETACSHMSLQDFVLLSELTLTSCGFSDFVVTYPEK